MTVEANLFETTAFNELKDGGVSVEEKSKTIHFGRVTIGGMTFDALDMRNVVNHLVNEDSIYLTDNNMIKVLKKYGILKYEGNNRWGSSAEGGPNLLAFRDLLDEKLSAFNFHSWEER